VQDAYTVREATSPEDGCNKHSRLRGCDGYNGTQASPALSGGSDHPIRKKMRIYTLDPLEGCDAAGTSVVDLMSEVKAYY
jgi:hypothetical protein